MEIAVAVIISFLIGAAFTYFFTQPLWERVDDLEETVYNEHKTTITRADNEIMDIYERLEAVEAKTQLPTGARPPGIYNETGELVFGAVTNPIEPAETEVGVVLDAFTTHCLDGTIGNEEQDD